MLGGILYTCILTTLFFLYFVTLRKVARMELSRTRVASLVIGLAIIVGLSFPLTSYDLFNYILTAKVTYHYHENPYLVMPIELIGEPGLAYTRAANKTALYGPTWIGASYIPHIFGGDTIWGQILAFKLFSSASYVAVAYLLFIISGSVAPVVWFALNPLVIIELLVNGHNDGLMMFICLSSYVVFLQKKRLGTCIGFGLLVLSSLVKGATLVLLPLMFWRQFPRAVAWVMPHTKKIHLTTPQTVYFLSSLLLAVAFLVAGPMREELYPWYGVWCLTFASLLDDTRYGWYKGLLIAGTVGLELRPIAYMIMGYYEGPGPLIRLLVTIVPVIGYSMVSLSIFFKRKYI